MSWKTVPLGQLAVKVGSGATPRGGSTTYLAERDRFALIRSQNVFDRELSTEQLAFISDDAASKLASVTLSELDLLLNITGDGVTFGRCCMVPKEILPAVVNQHVSIIRTDRTRLDPGYLLAVLSLPSTKSLLDMMNTGGSRRAITKAKIESIPILHPPLPTQRRIASVLSAYDDLIENNTQRIGVLEETVRSYWAAWLLTAQATSNPLGKLVSLVRAPVDPGTVEPTTPYLGLEHIPRRSFDLSEYGSAQSVTSTKIAFKTGDILFGKIRPYFHKVGPAPYDGITSSDTVVMRIHDSLDFAAVLLCVSSDLFVAEINQKANGAKMPRASWSDMSAYQVICGTQADRVLLNDVVLPRIELLQNLGRRNHALRAARDLLLPKLLSGELSVDRIPDPAAVAP